MFEQKEVELLVRALDAFRAVLVRKARAELNPAIRDLVGAEIVDVDSLRSIVCGPKMLKVVK